jgi:hypothetical protein
LDWCLQGIHWQAKYSAAGNDWHWNVKLVDQIFNIILADPTLYVISLLSFIDDAKILLSQRAKRGRQDDHASGSSPKKQRV